MTNSPAQESADALLAGLVDAGVTDCVLSPGSRSQALALAALDLEQAGQLRVHVRIDERVAGFTALGIAREQGRPVVVICTSGTAVANLVPAALEAKHAGVPLLLLTADRPPELQGVAANQTTDQPAVFERVAKQVTVLATPSPESAPEALSSLAHELYDVAMAYPAGSVHVDLPYREPLSAASAAASQTQQKPRVDDTAGCEAAPSAEFGTRDAVTLPRGPRTVVVAGADAGPAAEQFAHEANAPLVAEVTSNSRYGRNLVHAYRSALNNPELGGRIERVVVFGHPTLSRETTRLLSNTEVEIIAVDGPGERVNLNHATTAVAAVAIEPGEVDREWFGAWMAHSRDNTPDLSAPAPDSAALHSHDPLTRAEAVRAELGVVRELLTRELVADAVWRATWPHDRLVFGASRLIRVADQVVPGKKITVHANRGLAGIDGTISTTIGIALASQADGSLGTTRLLLGDLAFLHDIGALLLPEDEPVPRVQVIVGNDHGGTIFDSLEVSTEAPKREFDRAFYTPQNANLEALATAYGWQFSRAATRSELDTLLTTAPTGPQLIEVPLPR